METLKGVDNMSMIENALIKKIFLGFQEIPPGNNFTLRIQYETENFGFGTMIFNPLDIPKILKTFKINDIKDLEGLYIKIKRRKSEIGHAMQPILESDKWINTDTRYFDLYLGGATLSNTEVVDKLNKLHQENLELKAEIVGMEALLKSYRATIEHNAKLLADAVSKGYLPPVKEEGGKP